MPDIAGVEHADRFSMPPEGDHEPMEIATRLIAETGEFDHLRIGEASIVFIMREFDREKGQKAILGTMNLPKISGELGQIFLWMLARMCGGLPDYLMILDAEWWRQADPRQREALVYHELKHAVHAIDKHGELRFTEEGMPIWDIVAHDVEAFNGEIERYGAWKSDLVGFLAAAKRGGAM